MMIKAGVIRLRVSAILFVGIALGTFPALLRGQTPTAQASQSVTKALLDKARVQEAHGRLDLAVQTWQQVLLAEPENLEALGNLARASKLVGNAKLADSYQKRLRHEAGTTSPQTPSTAAPVESPAKTTTKSTAPPAAPGIKASVVATPAPTPIRQHASTRPSVGETARTRATDEIAAYQALDTNRIGDAETRFKAVLAGDPHNSKALAGMGFVRMQQGNFLGAISFLEEATRGNPDDKGAVAALDTSRFWFRMGEGQYALKASDLTAAEKNYRAALQLRPNNPEALARLGETLLRAQQPMPAISLFERAVQVDPASASGWRGLFMAQFQGGDAALALGSVKRIPPATLAQLISDPLFLQPLASAYSAMGRRAEAQATLQSALKQRFPKDVIGLESDIQIQLAGIMASANHLDQAAGMYKQVLADDAGNLAAWQGLVRLQHTTGHDAEALQTIQSMPPSAYAAAMRDTEFEIAVATIYQALKKPDAAPDVLQRAVTEQTNAGLKPSPAIETQLAGIYLERGSPQLAVPLYLQVIREQPDRLDAWAGLLSALHLSGHDQEALAQLQLARPAVRAQLESTPGYRQTIAAVYTALGRSSDATKSRGKVEQDHAAQRSNAASDTEIQRAWLLYDRTDDTGLYRQLMSLGGRHDLTAEQRRTVQTIWTNWATRRANQAAASGNPQRALAILNAAAKAFPDNPAAVKSLAAGYVQAGQPHEAYLIYKAQNMASASATDYETAVGAALADGDTKDAEVWLRYALASNPADPQILLLAAKFEQTRGDTGKAIRYYRASLKAMPPVIPGSKLAADPGLPALSSLSSLPSADLPQDLSTLLDPGYSDPTPTGGIAPEPYLPSYFTPSPSPPYDDSTKLVPPYPTNPDAAGPRKPVMPANQRPQAPSSVSINAPPAASAGEISSPSTPHVTPPPAPPVSEGGQVTASLPATSVQLGDNTPHPMQSQSEVTDVLPTVRYSPSARANQAAASHAEVAAARAARIRRLQEDSAAAKIGPNHAPPEDTIALATQQSAHPAPAQITPQLSQPSSPSAPPGPVEVSPDASRSSPPLAPALPLTPPPTDAELTARNLPPLGGSFESQVPMPMTQRQRAESELASLEGSYSGWLGATGIGRYRTGTAGLDRLYDVESPAEASAVFAQSIRLTVVALPVFLNSGVLNNLSFSAGNVPYLGTLSANSSNLSAQQFSNGIGGEIQLTTKNLGLAVGYTPYEFPVRNITGRGQWSPFGRHVSLYGERQPVKDTQLSYAGLHDPGIAFPALQSPIWGGVISNTGGMRLSLGTPNSTFFLSGEGGFFTGQHVPDNTRFGGATGANFRVGNWPAHGSLMLGGSLSGMHYAYNESGLSYGQGGYFSPSTYFLASAPVSFSGRYKSKFHYVLTGSLGVQTFTQDAALFYPLDPSLQFAFFPSNGAACTASQAPSYNCGEYPPTDTTAVAYAFNSETSYRLAEHWYGGGFVFADNSRNYKSVSAGFFFRYVFRAQHSPEGYPAGLFSLDGLRPLQIP